MLKHGKNKQTGQTLKVLAWHQLPKLDCPDFHSPLTWITSLPAGQPAETPTHLSFPFKRKKKRLSPSPKTKQTSRNDWILNGLREEF